MAEPQGVPNHRWNILDPRWTGVGIGIATGGRRGVYYTQNFLH
jgi:uncharacterized protein YkwD